MLLARARLFGLTKTLIGCQRTRLIYVNMEYRLRVPRMVLSGGRSSGAIGAMVLIVARGASIVTTSRLTAIRITARAVRPIRLVFSGWNYTAEHIGPW